MAVLPAYGSPENWIAGTPDSKPAYQARLRSGHDPKKESACATIPGIILDRVSQ